MIPPRVVDEDAGRPGKVSNAATAFATASASVISTACADAPLSSGATASAAASIPVENPDRAPLLRQPPANRLADPARASGHNRSLALQPSHHSASLEPVCQPHALIDGAHGVEFGRESAPPIRCAGVPAATRLS